MTNTQFSRHTFVVPSNVNRRTGPSSISGLYSSASAQVKDNVEVDEGVQIWKIPKKGTYRITARGAQGGTGPRSGSGGKGAVIEADFDLDENDRLHMLIGLEGRRNDAMVGGGGGTFVYTSRDDNGLLIVAGGGGGNGVGANDRNSEYAHARHDGTSGKPGWNGRRNISAGSEGDGGSADQSRGCGGGGWSGDGQSAGVPSGGGGSSVKNGSGHGGDGRGHQDGAFGGGGAVNAGTSYGACGGGGGYSGGGGAYSSSARQEAVGGGGGSYINESRRKQDSNTNRYGGDQGGNAADGNVTVRYIPEQSQWTAEYEHDQRVSSDRRNDLTDVQTGAVTSDNVLEKTRQYRERESSAIQSEEAAETAHAMEQANEDYKAMVAMMGQLNESQNATRYIDNSLDQELERIGKLNQESVNEVQKAQIRQLALDHEVQRSKFITRIIVFTIFISVLLSLVIGGWLQGVIPRFFFIIIAAIILVGYALAMALSFAVNSRRRQNHWKQLYHPGGKKMQCKFRKSFTPIVTLNAKCGFRGKTWNITGAGKYGKDSLEKNGIKNASDISVKVGSGYGVRFFRDDNYRDEIANVTKNMSCLENHENAGSGDDINSIEVYKGTAGG